MKRTGGSKMLRESLPVGPCPQISPPGSICRVSVHLLLSGAGEGDQEVGVRERRALALVG